MSEYTDIIRQLEKAEARAEKAEMEMLKAQDERDRAIDKLMEYEDISAKAQKASEMKSLFLANMSHEIRTPLNAIEGFSRIMAETDEPEERMRFLEIIESNNARLLSLINEILDLSRVEAGEIAIRKAPVIINEMCKGIIQVFKFRCPDSVKLETPKMPEIITMNTDENRITQVLSNLISNALKHTYHGHIRFGFNMLKDNREIEFYVEDTGTGIKESDIDEIFKTYVSRDAETKGNSFGLGLPLCKIIIEKMGGKIGVESEEGVGSRFYFILPFEGDITDDNSATTTKRTTMTIRVDKNVDKDSMKTVMVAEDEESNYELVKNILQKRYNLIRARNGIEAVTLNEKEHPDLILMDIRMPEMNGLDATRIIKEVNPSTPVIALSAFAFPESINEAIEAGCSEFLAKPFRVEELISTIEKYTK